MLSDMAFCLQQKSNIVGDSLEIDLEGMAEPFTREKLQLSVLRIENFVEITGIQASFNDDCLLLIPTRYNFPTLDAAFVIKIGGITGLVTFQATVAPEHPFLPHVVANLVCHLGRNEMPSQLKVWHVFVLKEEEKYQHFKCTGCAPVTLQLKPSSEQSAEKSLGLAEGTSSEQSEDTSSEQADNTSSEQAEETSPVQSVTVETVFWKTLWKNKRKVQRAGV
jgi:hypothetical protein